MLHDFPCYATDLYESVAARTVMSAISASRVDGGFAVGADGLCTDNDNPDDKIRGDTQKIFEIVEPGRILTYTISGLATSDDKEFNTYGEAKRLVQSFADQTFTDAWEYAKRLCSGLNLAVNSAVAHGHFTQLPKLNDADIFQNRWILIHVLLAGYWNGEPCAFRVS